MTNPLDNTQGPNVFERFLGLGVAIDNPLQLLGLSAKGLTEAGVITALQRQLTRIGASPDALTPEADEVRLALHAAAARLLDPTSRRQVLAGTSAPAAAPPDTNPGEVPVQAAMLMAMGASGGMNRRSIEKMAMLAKAHGLGPEQAVGMVRDLMSHPSPPQAGPAARKPAPPRMGMPARPGAIGATAVGPTATAMSAPSSFDPSAPMPEEVDPARGTVKAILLFGGAGLLGIATIAILITALLSGNNGSPGPAPSPAPSTATNTTPSPDKQLFPVQPKGTANAKPQPIGVTQARIGDWTDLIRNMSACVAGLDVDAPGAADRFEEVYAEMSHKWGEASPDGVVAAVDRIVEYLYHVGAHPDIAPRAIAAIVDGAAPLKSGEDLTPAQVSSVPWSVGVLARLGRERDLPTSVRHRVQEALGDTFPGSSGPGDSTFKSGAVAALSVIPQRLAKSSGKPDAKPESKADAKADSKPDSKPDAKQNSEAWKAWISALGAIDGKQSPLFTRTTLLALDYLLTAAPEPAQDRTVFDAVSLLTVALPWRKDDESRRWLLRWFDSPGVTAGDLYSVTAALATQSAAEGVDSSMVLSAGAGESQRAELRDRYAAVWGLTAGQTRDALVAQWAKAVAAVLPPVPLDPDKSPVDALERTVTLARLNQAAALLWSGDTGAVPDLLDPYKPLNPAVNPYVTAPGQSAYQFKFTVLNFGGGSGRSADWLIKYCAAGQNILIRRELLGQMTRAPDPAESDILVKEACRGSPAALRAEARTIVMTYKDNAAIINSMLEFAPMVPITTDNNDLIEQISYANLPSIKDPTWRVAARRALVERLCEVVASEGDLARVDVLSDALAATFLQPVPKPADAESAPAPLTIGKRKPPPPPLEAAAGALRGRWQREAELLVASGREPLNLGQVEVRRSARLRLAVGRIQDFAAEQVNICELMSYVVTAEQPGKAEEVLGALDALAEARRRSKHVFEQIEAGERARLKLWLSRFGEPQS